MALLAAADGQPILTETAHNGIEDCIAIQPSKNSARETTVLHLEGLKNSTSHAQGFPRAGFIPRNFVDCSYLTSETLAQVFSSAPNWKAGLRSLRTAIGAA